MKYYATIVTASAFAVAGASAAGSVRERQLQQASAKFAAAWSTDVEIAGECLNTDNEDMLTFWGSSILNFGWCGTVPNSTSTDLVLSQFAAVGKIKIPQQKEILINLSAQIDILTVNTATSHKRFEDTEFYGNIGATSASAGVTVQLYAIPDSTGSMIECMPPGGVTMASRYVELRNLIGGNVTYEDCYNDDDDELFCQTKIADVELESTIGLAMDTSAAHSFQWLCVDMDSDVYDVVAQFSLTAAVANLCDDTNYGDCSDNVDLAAARVALNKRIMTVQEVRAVKNAFADLS